MRKIIIACSFALLSANLNAQKNTVLVYGNIAYTDFNAEEIHRSLETNTGTGYQFNKNWTAGLSFSYNNQTQRGQQQQLVYKTSSITAGPFMRYTHTVSSLFWVYGQIEGGYASIKYHKSSSQINSARRNGFYASLFPALFMNIKNSFGLNFNIGGINYTQNKFSESKIRQFNFTLGKSVSIGVSKNF